MKIIATSDWHLGNLFHGNDRLSEHRHFVAWLLGQLKELQPDALLIAGDVFDNSNPSAAAQSVYYEFIADAISCCPQMHIVITAGNHDSASRLEAPRPLLARHNVQIRGHIKRTWQNNEEGGSWSIDYEDLIVPINDEVVVLAVPYLRNDVVQDVNYSRGVTRLLSELTARAKTIYPRHRLIMMAHMYAKGADIAPKEASEKIIIGGQEEVNMEGWNNRPDYLTCGHIHKRQHIWNTEWARYTGSVLPMSFTEKDYTHGVDLITTNELGHIVVDKLQYIPQHSLCVLPDDESGLTVKQLIKLIDKELPERTEGKLDEDFVYVVLKVKMEKISNDDIKALENAVDSKNAVLCKIQKIMPQLDVNTIAETQKITSIDDILNRDPMDAIEESYLIHHQEEMNEHQKAMLNELLREIQNDNND